MKASDIPDATFLAAARQVIRLRSQLDRHPATWASRWDIAAVLAGNEQDVGVHVRDYPHMPEKVVLAKARRLIRRGLLAGCGCGCRGDFQPLEQLD